MSTVGKGIGLAVAGVTGWASLAYACSPLPQVYSALPESAAPGETVVVSGQAVRSEAPVEIRWNGAKGEVLAVVTPDRAGSFSIPVVVPAATPGVYALTVATADAGANRTSFEVTAPASASQATAAPAQLWPQLASGSSLAEPSSAGPNATGVALLGFGLVALAGGSAVALTRRRRVLAGAEK